MAGVLDCRWPLVQFGVLGEQVVCGSFEIRGRTTDQFINTDKDQFLGHDA